MPSRSLSSEPPGDPDHTLAEVHLARDQAEALVVKGLLEAHGVASVLRTQIVHSVHPFTVADLGVVRILVRTRDRRRALSLLAARRASS